jgi:hypothetical protein
MAEINRYSVLTPHIGVAHLSGTTNPVHNFTNSVNPFLKIFLAHGHLRNVLKL